MRFIGVTRHIDFSRTDAIEAALYIGHQVYPHPNPGDPPSENETLGAQAFARAELRRDGRDEDLAKNISLHRHTIDVHSREVADRWRMEYRCGVGPILGPTA